MNYYTCLPFKLNQGFCSFFFHTLSPYRPFSLTWSLAIQIYYETRKRLHQHRRCDVMSKALQHWRIQGQRGARERPGPPPYSLGTSEARRAKKIILETGYPYSQGLDEANHPPPPVTPTYCALYNIQLHVAPPMDLNSRKEP